MDRRKVALGTGLSLGAALGMSATAEAVNFKVSTLSDSGKGSLRQAVLDANAKNGSDTILFASGLSGTVGLTSGQLAITGPVAIQGSGASRIAVSGSNASRIFQIDLTASGQPVSISGLRLTKGASGASAGGAISNVDSALTVSGAVISGNTTAAGAITSAQPGSSLTLRTSTVSGNVASGVGGGLITGGTGAVLIANSTISGNAAPVGGGLVDYGGTGPIAISGSTIAGNTATTNAGGIYRTSAPMTLTSTIVADNSAPTGPDVAGSVSAGFSLIENPAGATVTSTAPNFLGQDPKLAALASNGGPTQTQALLAGSPAFDTGLASGLATDQRGAARPFD